MAEINPKDLQGLKKVPMSAVPAVAIAHEALAFLDGELKYGARNWRENPVRASVYIDAALRHLRAYEEGEDEAQDSGVHHLAHARACLGILLDAMETVNLVDDLVPGVFPELAERLSAWVQQRKARAIAESARAKSSFRRRRA